MEFHATVRIDTPQEGRTTSTAGDIAVRAQAVAAELAKNVAEANRIIRNNAGYLLCHAAHYTAGDGHECAP
jgi:hypothetical protein